MSKPKNEIDRRSFLKASLVAGGSLLLSFNLPANSRAEEKFNAPQPAQTDFQPNAYFKIAKDGKVTVIVGQSEMGQGVLTSLPMIIAEELEVEWKNVAFESGPADKAFINSTIGSQVTGGSSSVKAFFEPLRKSAASVREMLVSAAAETWKVAPETCRAESGKVVHAATKRAIAYGDLLERAAQLTPNPNPKLKDPKDFKIIGKSMPRLDTPGKVDGSGIFGIDVKVEGMLTATILRCPVFEGKVKSVDDTAAKAVKGVRSVLPLGYGVGIVADNYWAAKKGRDALKVEWDGGKFAGVSSEAIYRTYAEAAANEKGLTAKKVGDASAAKSSAVKTVEAVYFAPYLSHATMEPMNFTADVRGDSCELWGGIQGQLIIQKVVAQTLGLAPEKVKVNTTLLGGGFGRRIGLDYVLDAVLLSKSVGKPVKVVWTREDDIQHDFYRPATYNKMSAGVDASGKPVFWEHRVVNPSIIAPIAPVIFGFALPDTQVDDSSVEGASTLPYDIPNLQVDWIRKETGVPVGFWRSVGSSHTAFSTECFLDELAFAAGRDPLQFRLSLLENHPRHRGVLELAATKAGWGKPLPQGVFQGIAVHESFGSFVAQVADVSVAPDGGVKVRRVVCAVDCGQVVNPDTVAAQMESSIIFGLTAALYGEITIKDGRVEQRNFYDYKMLRMHESPPIEVYIVPSTEKHGGVGEPGTPPIAPAVVNAIFAATGKRIRRLPIRTEELKKA
ncbi:MAG TPA: xanthine dehydrogenase family protein molybdopterin-binding subunit [Pyrinomonadaceae bacterium]|jgi:isoquinoline 1-oxidoreductase beta subunit